MTRRQQTSAKKIIQLENELIESELFGGKDLSYPELGLYVSGERDVVE
jgi:hypothetical protein